MQRCILSIARYRCWQIKFKLTMNVNHKCHFHPELPITKFCPKMCTLPLCSQCETIHLEDHASQSQDTKLMRFNEAYVQAINSIEDFLEQQKNNFKKEDAKLQSDREAVLKYIDNYYSNASKVIEEAKGKCHQIQQKLSKLKKGSIKTLIFYYSGDIELSNSYTPFTPLINSIKNAEIQRVQPPKDVYRHQDQHITLTRHQNNNQKTEIKNSIDAKYTAVDTHTKQIGAIDARNVGQQRKIQIVASNTVQDAFSGIQQLRVAEKNRQKSRKSIFDNTKRSTILQNYPKNEQTKVQDAKYQYNFKASIENQEETDSLKAAPTFNYLPQQHQYTEIKNVRQTQRRQQNLNERRQQKYQKQGNYDQEGPVSFEHRYMNKFSGAEQYEAYKKQRQQKIFKQLNYHHNKSIEQKQNNLNIKILKPSDLQIDKQQQIQKIITTNSPLTTQRMRTMSQTNFNERDRKETLGYDLKKQVLPPEQIRKMLEKRIEERNRILSIKKGENIPQPTTYEHEAHRRGWETKDSIINQIYHDPKY